MLSFLFHDMDPFQYLESNPQDVSYMQNRPCNSFINSVDQYLWCQVQERLKLFPGIFLFTNKVSHSSKQCAFLGVLMMKKKMFHTDF